MILVDLSNILFRTIFGSFKSSDTIDEVLVRRIAVSKLLYLQKKFRDELVVCFDQGLSWRCSIFPEYKANRRTEPDARKIEVLQNFAKLRTEFLDVLPFGLVSVDRAEADDVMAVLSRRPGTHVVASGDKDMTQLLAKNVRVFNPFGNNSKGSFTTCDDIPRFKYEHIVKGDSSDGVPNILSDSRVLVTEGIRQASVTKKYLEANWEAYNDGVELGLPGRLKLNIDLIDFDRIPHELADSINVCYDQDLAKRLRRRNNWTKYCAVNQLGDL